MSRNINKGATRPVPGKRSKGWIYNWNQIFPCGELLVSEVQLTALALVTRIVYFTNLSRSVLWKTEPDQKTTKLGLVFETSWNDVKTRFRQSGKRKSLDRSSF